MYKTMLLITERTNDIPEYALMNYHGSTETRHTVSHYGSRQRLELHKKHGTPIKVDLSHTFVMFGVRFICEEYRPMYKAQLAKGGANHA